jgi:hypothetical protein
MLLTPAKAITCDFGSLWIQVFGVMKFVSLIVKVIVRLLNKNSGIVSILSNFMMELCS